MEPAKKMAKKREKRTTALFDKNGIEYTVWRKTQDEVSRYFLTPIGDGTIDRVTVPMFVSMIGRKREVFFKLTTDDWLSGPGNTMKSYPAIVGKEYFTIRPLLQQQQIDFAPTQVKTESEEDMIPTLPMHLITTKNFNQIVANIEKLVDKNIPILLKGDAGSGKNVAIAYLAVKKHMPVIRVNCSGDLRTNSLLGRPAPKDDGTFEWQDGLITQAIRNGYWLVLDEINALEADILFAIHGLLDEWKISIANSSKIVKAHPNFRLFATMNPSRYVATRPLNQALYDRLVVIDLPYDVELDKEMIKRLGVTKDLEISLQKLIVNLREAFNSGQVSQPFGHRTLSKVVELAAIFDLYKAIDLAYLDKLEPLERAAGKTIIDDFTRQIRSV